MSTPSPTVSPLQKGNMGILLVIGTVFALAFVFVMIVAMWHRMRKRLKHLQILNRVLHERKKKGKPVKYLHSGKEVRDDGEYVAPEKGATDMAVQAGNL